MRLRQLIFTPTSTSAGNSRAPVLLMALVIAAAFSLVSRLPVITIPQLDWDEGTRMSIASSLNHGRALYVTAWDHHTFLDLLFFQSLFAVLSPQVVPVAIRVANLAIAMLLSGFVCFGIIRAGGKTVWSFAAVAVAGFLLAQDWAASAHGEFYHSLPVAAAFYLFFLYPPARGRSIAAGCLLGLGFFIKQTAIFDLGAFMLLAFWQSGVSDPSAARARLGPRLSWAGAGAGLVLGFTVVYFLAKGALREAVYMTFVDPLVYSTGTNLESTLGKFEGALIQQVSRIISLHSAIALGAATSLIALAVDWRRLARREQPEVLAAAAWVWLITDILGLMCIGRFYDHYLCQLIVPLAICSTFVMQRTPAILSGIMAAWLLAGLLVPVFKRQDISSTRDRGSQHWHDVFEAAAFVRARTTDSEGIYLYQDPALCVYYLAERFPPVKVFMDHQLLPENKDAAQLLPDALRGLQQNPPKFVVRGNLGRSVPEIDQFIQSNYTPNTNFGIHTIFRLDGNSGGKSEINGR